MLVELGLTGKLAIRMIHLEAILSGLGKTIFWGGAVPLAVYKDGMLESFLKEGSALIDFVRSSGRSCLRE